MLNDPYLLSTTAASAIFITARLLFRFHCLGLILNKKSLRANFPVVALIHFLTSINASVKKITWFLVKITQPQAKRISRYFPRENVLPPPRKVWGKPIKYAMYTSNNNMFLINMFIALWTQFEIHGPYYALLDSWRNFIAAPPTKHFSNCVKVAGCNVIDKRKSWRWK